MGKMMRALGLMSGTSLDGIDVALIETDGETVSNRLSAATYAYDAETRRVLKAAIAEARTMTDRSARPGSLRHAEQVVTDQHIATVHRFLSDMAVDRGSIAIAGFHGQTVLHVLRDKPNGDWNSAPSNTPHLQTQTGVLGVTPFVARSMMTVQLGDGPALANAIGIPVVYDLRAADCEAGGQGAPLVPVYHRALMANVADRPVAIVNIGGVANVTWIGRNGELIAFDTGPGNALLDDWMMKHRGVARDDNGDTSARGRVHDDVVKSYLSSAFFNAAPPKSLDRNDFTSKQVDELSVEDGAATLAALTAGAIAKAREHMPEEPALWVICGGGRFNRTIMNILAGAVENAVVPAEVAHLNGDSIEAEAWGYLAVRSVVGLPITFPGTTGIRQPLTGGKLARP